MAKKKLLNQKQINDIIQYAYLNLDSLENIDSVKGPLADGIFEDESNKPIKLFKVFMNPDYFYFTCKHLLNIDLLPFQAVILRELWNRPFPMLIQNRGGGKSFILGVYCILKALLVPGSKIVICGAAFRQAKLVYEYAETIWYNAPVLRDICGSGNNQGPHKENDRVRLVIGSSTITAIPLGDGTKIRGLRATDLIADEFACLRYNTLIETDKGLIRIEDCLPENKLINRFGNLEQPQKMIITPPTESFEVTTRNGYNFVCSNIHQVETTNGFKLAKDLSNKDYLIMENKYKFPTKNPDGLNKNLAWMFGLFTSEGSVNDKYTISVHMTDIDCINRLKTEWEKFNPNLHITEGYREAYIDDRGWECKESYYVNVTSIDTRNYFEKLGLKRNIAIDKTIPWSVLQSDKETVLAYLAGLFEGDGSCFLWKDKKNDRSIGVALYSSSKRLCEEVQIVLLKLGYSSYISKRRSKISKNWQYFVRLNGKDAHDFAQSLKITKWVDVINNCIVKTNHLGYSVIFDKSRNKWKATVLLNGKPKYVGRYESQELATIAALSAMPPAHVRVKSVKKIDDSEILYDFYLPETHSFYGNGFVQHNSIPKEIYETVVGGFGAVSQSPDKNVKNAAARRELKRRGADDAADLIPKQRINKSIISGTAYYDFNHFAEYYRKYKAYIESRGNIEKLREVFGGKVPDKDFDWKDYSVIRIPVELLPEEFMDMKNVARSMANSHSGSALIEYGACFAKDSNGFFKRTLVESCVVSEDKLKDPNISWPEGTDVFSAMVSGHRDREYVYGIDPASENDNFSIVILELRETHVRVVYCWTMNKKRHRDMMNRRPIEQDYYKYCARKIRDLMKIFPAKRLTLDSQGGGYAIAEALHDKTSLQTGEQPIWEIVEDGKVKDTDNYDGLHILEMVSFANAEWMSKSNEGMRADFEHKILQFPFFDTIELSEAMIEDNVMDRDYDTLEDCVMEIEALKDELATIIHTQTANGRDRWDTPEKVENGKKGRQRKDRYSALLMANMSARTMARSPAKPAYNAVGGFADKIAAKKAGGSLYTTGPDWYVKWANQVLARRL